MKYLKYISELHSSTYKSAGEQLKRLGHRERADKLNAKSKEMKMIEDEDFTMKHSLINHKFKFKIRNKYDRKEIEDRTGKEISEINYFLDDIEVNINLHGDKTSITICPHFVYFKYDPTQTGFIKTSDYLYSACILHIIFIEYGGQLYVEGVSVPSLMGDGGYSDPIFSDRRSAILYLNKLKAEFKDGGFLFKELKRKLKANDSIDDYFTIIEKTQEVIEKFLSPNHFYNSDKTDLMSTSDYYDSL